MVDAVVIGAGPNGLVAANHLLDAGWTVRVLEAQPEPGGAVKSAELIEPGYVNDIFSSFYPLAAFSPALTRLDLPRYGLHWLHGPLVLAHPAADGTCVALSRDLDETAASLDSFASGDGDAWRELVALWTRIAPAAKRLLVTPMPPVAAAAQIVAALGPARALQLARDTTLPMRRFVEERFTGAGAARLLTGNALHADFTPDSALGGLFAFVLTALGQTVGFPVAAGGAGNLTGALVRRLEERGGTIVCGERAEAIVVQRGRATGVRTAGGEIGARRAVVADVDAVALYLRLLPHESVPPRVRAAIGRFQRDPPTLKVDWTLDAPVPWSSEEARRAPVVHVGEHGSFLIFGQYSMVDPSRAPAGKETAWAYVHVPLEADPQAVVEWVEATVEELAPGFRALIRARHVLTPADLEARDENLVDGALNGGTAQLHQQLVFRPVPGLGRPETGVRGLYLASASAHPGGGVHGGPGAIAARAAINARRARRVALAVGGLAAAAAARGR